MTYGIGSRHIEPYFTAPRLSASRMAAIMFGVIVLHILILALLPAPAAGDDAGRDASLRPDVTDTVATVSFDMTPEPDVSRATNPPIPDTRKPPVSPAPESKPVPDPNPETVIDTDKASFAWGVKKTKTPLRPSPDALLAEQDSRAASPSPGNNASPLPAATGETGFVANLDRLGAPNAPPPEQTGKTRGDDTVTPLDTHDVTPADALEENRTLKTADPQPAPRDASPDTPPDNPSDRPHDAGDQTAFDQTADVVTTTADPALALLVKELDKTIKQTRESKRSSRAIESSASSKSAGESDTSTAGDPTAASRTTFQYDMEFAAGQIGDPAFDAIKSPVAVYLKDLRRTIETKWYNASEAIKRFSWPQGDVVVRMTILKDGRIVNVAKIRASQSVPTKYVSATLTAVKKSGPYAPFPDDIKPDHLTLTLRFLYR